MKHVKVSKNDMSDMAKMPKDHGTGPHKMPQGNMGQKPVAKSKKGK